MPYCAVLCVEVVELKIMGGKELIEKPKKKRTYWWHKLTRKTVNANRTLSGSCQCGGVEFTLQSHTPVPYQLCACSICRKVGGYGGSVNLGGIAESLVVVKGKDLIKYVRSFLFTFPFPFSLRRCIQYQYMLVQFSFGPGGKWSERAGHGWNDGRKLLSSIDSTLLSPNAGQ